jgi:hypothetical protein
MELLRKMLANREDNQAGILAKKLDRLWIKKQKEKDSRVKKLRLENIKSERRKKKNRFIDLGNPFNPNFLYLQTFES